MLEEILNYLHNYFVLPAGRHAGEFTVSSGTIILDFLQEGQYFRIVGSVFNDGVYTYPPVNLIDEVFVGEVQAMAVPSSVVALSEEIEAWCKDNPPSRYTSEAFGGYSYSLGTGGNTGVPAGWQDVFRGRLRAWKKVS